ncbi:MAG TPA: hypothetical protein VM557_09070 [Thermoanaerobaculia bacterium]|nr:hypothetical protein [Thermoanaerobaculia bacterium]
MENHLPLIFAFAACSWLPHFTCHYYKLETRSSFIVGAWRFTPMHSALAMLFYAGLASLNLVAIEVAGVRTPALLISAACHAALGALHLYRLTNFFPFEVFGYPWSRGSSTREAIMELALGAGFLLLAIRIS